MPVSKRADNRLRVMQPDETTDSGLGAPAVEGLSREVVSFVYTSRAELKWLPVMLSHYCERALKKYMCYTVNDTMARSPSDRPPG